MSERTGGALPSLALRPVAVADAEAMAVALADPALHAYTGGEPATREQLERRYAVQERGRSADGSERWLNLLVLLGDERLPIGYVQATLAVDDDEAEIAWVIGRPWQGRGLASRAAHLLVDELARLGARRLVAHIHPEHAASEGIARSLGLRRTEVVVDGELRWIGTVDGARIPPREGEAYSAVDVREPGASTAPPKRRSRRV